MENFTRQLLSPCTTMPCSLCSRTGTAGRVTSGWALHRHLRLTLCLMLVQDALDVLPQTADELQAGDAAVANGGVHIVQTLEGELFQDDGGGFPPPSAPSG